MPLHCIIPTKLIDEVTRRAVRFEREIFEKIVSRCKPTTTALQSNKTVSTVYQLHTLLIDTFLNNICAILRDNKRYCLAKV